MVQSIENWAEVEGEVAGLEAAGEPGLDGYVGVRLVGVTVRDVAGYANLVAAPPAEATGAGSAAGLVVLVPSSSVPAGLAGGSHVVARVRKARPGRMFAHPEHFQLV